MQQTRLILGILFVTFLVTFLILFSSGFLSQESETNRDITPTRAVQSDQEQEFISDYFDGNRDELESNNGEAEEYDCLIGGARLREGAVSGDTICVSQDTVD